MNWDEVGRELDRKLDPKHVKPPSKYGPKGNYIEGWHAISEANRIFGHGGWSYVIKSMTQDSLVEGVNGKGEPQWQAAYTCIVTLTVGDVVREDVGFGSGFAKQIGDAVEGATKEAVTDALKRCLRTFGNPFGLALYDKSGANVGVDDLADDTPKFDSAAARDRLKGMIERAPTIPRLSEIKRDEAETLNLLSDPHFAEVKAAFSKRHSDLTGDDKAMQAPPQDEHMYG